jgi:hypothetical protein
LEGFQNCSGIADQFLFSNEFTGIADDKQKIQVSMQINSHESHISMLCVSHIALTDLELLTVGRSLALPNVHFLAVSPVTDPCLERR